MAERRRRRATSNEQQATSGEAPSADAGPQLDPVAPGRAIDEARRERDQALEQQRATAEVLRVISRSEEGLETSLQTVADAAARICRADLSQVWLRDGDYLVAGPSGPADAVSVLVKPGERLGPIADSPGPGLDAARTGRTVQVDDFERYLGERGGPRPLRSRRAAADPWGGARTVLAVPLLRTTETFGVLMLSRRGGGRTFDSGEIALAETFADQAAIAVVNARLFDELQQRNREQAEALEREQATAEVLRVISRSPESLDVALQAVADTAARLCRADVAQTWLRDGDFLVAGPTARLAGPADIFPPGRRLGPIATHAGPPPAAARTGKTVHVEDMLQYWVELGWTGNELEQAMELTRRIGARTVLAVPLLRGTDVVGVVALIRVDEVRRFAAREIALAETFADQAAIAVENAGLFQAIRESNRELTEALEQQTATADVLRIIS